MASGRRSKADLSSKACSIPSPLTRTGFERRPRWPANTVASAARGVCPFGHRGPGSRRCALDRTTDPSLRSGSRERKPHPSLRWGDYLCRELLYLCRGRAIRRPSPPGTGERARVRGTRPRLVRRWAVTGPGTRSSPLRHRGVCPAGTGNFLADASAALRSGGLAPGSALSALPRPETSRAVLSSFVGADSPARFSQRKAATSPILAKAEEMRPHL
jgi:hypothetical protein